MLFVPQTITQDSQYVPFNINSHQKQTMPHSEKYMYKIYEKSCAKYRILRLLRLRKS